MGISPEEVAKGQEMLKTYLKKIEIKQHGAIVKAVYWYDLITEQAATAFAEGLRRTFGGEE